MLLNTPNQAQPPVPNTLHKTPHPAQYGLYPVYIKIHLIKHNGLYLAHSILHIIIGHNDLHPAHPILHVVIGHNGL
jgi:hypothetical protein